MQMIVNNNVVELYTWLLLHHAQATLDGVTVFDCDLKTLDKGNWLIDSIVSFYFA